MNDESGNKVLGCLNLDKLPFWRRVPSILVVILLFLGFTSGLLAYLSPESMSENLFKVTTAALAVFALMLGYWQWMEARNEVSYDKYYDRIHSANERFTAYRLAELSKEDDNKTSHLHTMFVFYQIDLLEYAELGSNCTNLRPDPGGPPRYNGPWTPATSTPSPAYSASASS